MQNTYNTGLYQRLHRKLAESVGGTANGHAQQGVAPLPDIAVGAADHGLAAMGAGGIPALDLNWVDTRYSLPRAQGFASVINFQTYKGNP